MNVYRRKRLNAIVAKLSEVYSDLEEIVNEESEAFENIPENLQGSERYGRAEEIAYNLEEAFENLEEMINTLDECTN